MEDKFVSILGVNFINTNMKDMVERLKERMQSGQKGFVVTANPEIVMKALEDPTYKKYVEKADYVTADGIGVVKGAQILGKPLPERVAGYDLMRNLLTVLNEKKLKLYMLGAQEETIEKAVQTIKVEYPDLQIAGYHHGFFKWEDPAIINEIQETQPDLILVALGMPRQEKWIAEHIDHVEKGVFIGVGGSFDVIAGTVKRAPEFWQKLNLEWFYRLLKQPSRWRRMLALPHFALKVVGQKISGRN
ncbi:WecB/TagA/CpsF family glycosyltransferase [Schinkia azotoformans]|uniref:N-acetylglucosaminyldiphosphoundecaprenol N-acetyl-beta-D-mannosaminyltransferase n=1 Tax=Schinkia azotoformans LMG 9581 TaxID=1131731 RepID=K6DJU2_SCHAZ|nr:WecB/TagA/CpsF family glycosyltransferase [Schinkia azotoformans]EKN68564.1 putative N-acetylmannosaminyltransferase [Schinkia azotoformans LMG 9581]MEC1637589.1 WecB/TagA/CpsF family glycosyltransferase [Schinkia azotoformans]MEC1718835.1 WecB/TagA/CpsF family glycosyltransferase [Schinkia azotoformans]MEC1943993.1 WecB/TagA/CpsF family glycosyltransferase [Schinkia azotoformans]MED4350992.1 WecB/TagA/CpsF family glycosyltransferase [Schinkia azotoformans]